MMFRHILLPTDGSALSREAISCAVLFALNIGARLTGVHVLPTPQQDRLEAWIHQEPQHASRKKALLDRMAADYLAFIANSALAEGVPCHCRTIYADLPWQAILNEARHQHCDLIFMASHGSSKEAQSGIGSQTEEVVRHSSLPVLVYRTPAHSPRIS